MRMDVSHTPDISRREEETICLVVTYPIPTVVSTYPNRKGPAWPYSPSHPAHFALPRGHNSTRRTRPAPTQRGQLALAPARRLPRESGAKATPPALATSMQLPTAKPINQRPTALGARRSPLCRLARPRPPPKS